jgi:hypothetical protein
VVNEADEREAPLRPVRVEEKEDGEEEVMEVQAESRE